MAHSAVATGTSRQLEMRAVWLPTRSGVTATVEPPVTAEHPLQARGRSVVPNNPITPNNPIRVAVLGFWHVHAAEYAARVRQHPDTELVAVWDDDPDRGRAAAEAVEAAFVDDLDKLLARDDIDAVTVTTATSAHRAIMLSAAQAGKHIFTEKLLAPTVAEAEEIIDTADKAGIALVVSLPPAADTQAILGQLDEGRLGELIAGSGCLTMGRSPAGCRNASMTPRRPSAVRSAISDAIRSTSRSFSSVRSRQP